MDQAVLKASMETIAAVVAERVAPRAVINSYNNDGRIRSVIRSAK
jgi:hypothetical protein